MPNIAPFEKYTHAYENWFSVHTPVYESELQAVRALLPDSGPGLEIGVGSGRFAAPLGVEYGVEPAEAMRKIAEQRGIRTKQGLGESLPYPAAAFAYALMITTLCFLEDPRTAFQEAYRVLRPGGTFLVGFVDRTSPVGREYERFKTENVFYRDATFYTVPEVTDLLIHTGFTGIRYRQTVFHSLEAIAEAEPVMPGYGEGSFIVIGAAVPPSSTHRDQT